MRFHNLLRVSWSMAFGLGLLAAGQAAAASSPRSAVVATTPALAADPASAPEDAAAAKQLIDRALEQLSPPARMIITLMEIEDRPVKEIAQLTGWSATLVKVRAFRARAELRKVLARMTYHHPVYTHAAVAAQRRHREINGVNRTWYCGAYWGYGFHEDGVVSALDTWRQFDESTANEKLYLRRAS